MPTGLLQTSRWFAGATARALPKLPKKKKLVNSRHISPFLNIRCALKYTLKGVMICISRQHSRGCLSTNAFVARHLVNLDWDACVVLSVHAVSCFQAPFSAACW